MYNNRLYKVQHLKNKLKKLGITEQDIEIIPEKKQSIEYEDPNRLYYFINKQTGYSITSIYPYVNDDGYEPISLEHLEEYWNKTR